MVSRSPIQNTTANVNAFGGSINRVIPNVFALYGALSLIEGQFSSTAAGGYGMTQASYGLTASLFELRQAIAEALIPIIKEISPLVEAGIDQFVEWDRATDGLSTRQTIAAGGALLLRNRLLGIARLVGYGVAAGLGASGVQDVVEGGPEQLFGPESKTVDRARQAQDQIFELFGTFVGLNQEQIDRIPRLSGIGGVIPGLANPGAVRAGETLQNVTQSTINITQDTIGNVGQRYRENIPEVVQGAQTAVDIAGGAPAGLDRGIGLKDIYDALFQLGGGQTRNSTFNVTVTGTDEEEFIRMLRRANDNGTLDEF